MIEKYAAILDRCGIAVSAVCAVHCAAAPLAFGGLLSAPLGLLQSETSEVLLIALAALAGSVGLTRGYRQRHRRRCCLATFAAGFTLLLAAETVFHGGFGAAAAASGASCMAVAHLLNLKLCRSCPDCRDD